MTTKPRILVTSAGGNTGLHVALQLLAKKYPVRAFMRVDDRRATRLREAGAEIFIGDQYAVGDMRKAMSGMQRAYHCAPTAPNGLFFNAVFAVAAREARIEHIASMSQWLSQAEHPSLFTRETWLGDNLLDMVPGATLTTINPGWFAGNYFMVLEPVAQLGLLPMPLGDGDVPGNAPPSNEDSAAVAVGALIDPSAHAGNTYRPTGPELLSPNQIAAAMGKVLGRKVRYNDVSDAMLLKALVALRPANFSWDTITQLQLYAEEYRRGAFAVGAPTDAVEKVGGRPPESFETIARRVVAERPEARRSVANRLKAVAGFVKVAMTPKPDTAAIMRRSGHVLIAAPQFARESGEWLRSHDPAAGVAVQSAKIAPALAGPRALPSVA